MSDWLRGHVLTLANSPFFKAVEEMGPGVMVEEGVPVEFPLEELGL